MSAPKRPLEEGDTVRWTRYGDPKSWRVSLCSGQLVCVDSVEDPCLHATDHKDRFELLPEPAVPFALFWVDVETTGLDPQLHDLLELAYVLTSFVYPYEKVSQVNVCAEAEYLVAGLATDTLVEGGNSNPFITKMHEESGLTAALRAAKHSTTGRTLTTLGRLEDDLLELSKDWPIEKDTKIMLAGNSVHFDLSFIRAKLPTFAKRLSHRVFDVSAQRLFLESLGMPKLPKTDAAHRARQDVEESMRTARACAEWVRAKKENPWPASGRLEWPSSERAVLNKNAEYGKGVHAIDARSAYPKMFSEQAHDRLLGIPVERLLDKCEKMKEALAPLVAIANAYDANNLDDEARKRWGPNLEHENVIPPENLYLYSGRGGEELLTLAHCFRARDVARGKS